MYVASVVYVNDYASWHVLCFKHFMYVHVHGASFLDVYNYGSILFVSWRVRDVTEWYQS